MFDTVDMIFEYVSLLTAPNLSALTPAQRNRVDVLARFLGPPSFEVREYARLEVSGPVEFDGPEDVGGLGTVVDIGGGGVGITTQRPLATGSHTAVRFFDTSSRQLYEFPCIVVWARRGQRSGMGLKFAGKPSRTPVTTRGTLGRLSVGIRLAQIPSTSPGLEYEDTELAPADERT